MSKIYEDTKIRLHFSTFKVLEDNRDTCFVDPPHQCLEFVKNPQEEIRHSEF